MKGEVARQYYPGRTIAATREQLLKAFYTRITPAFCRAQIAASERYINSQIAADDEFKHLGRVGEFSDPPVVHPSDEIIDLTFLEDDHDDDLSDHED